MKRSMHALLFYSLGLLQVYSQSNYWQQKVQYSIEVVVNDTLNHLNGQEKLIFTNNSPDTLNKVFFHLYWNAFQKGSMMHALSEKRSKTIVNIGYPPDSVYFKFNALKPDEVGYQKIKAIKLNGVLQKFQVDETIMEVFVDTPILPGKTVSFEINFEAQIPLLLRRSGRDYPDTHVKYSIAQWYPKICEYDKAGWHPTPYVEREFYGVWGDFDVSISLPKKYTIGGTGNLQNKNVIGHGYEDYGVTVPDPKEETLKWHFIANNVHDFMWSADPSYIHLKDDSGQGTIYHVLYVNPEGDPDVDSQWKELMNGIALAFPYMEEHFGNYPYQQFSVIQGGDGGMEYPMSCLISSPNVSQAFHEMAHNWYYGLLGNNESLYAWMDEGFAIFARDILWDLYLNNYVEEHPENERVKGIAEYFNSLLPYKHAEEYGNYFALAKSDFEEPLTTHADHFKTKVGYDYGDYAKGEVFLEQLGYIVGAGVRDSILLEYYKRWRFKHPEPNDFMQVAEKISGLKLDWYYQDWINTTNHIDYAIESIWSEQNKTKILLRNNGSMAMPIDLYITYADGNSRIAYIPQYLMFGSKSSERTSQEFQQYPPWKWTSATYELTIDVPMSQIKQVEIDKSQRMADIERSNNLSILKGN